MSDSYQIHSEQLASGTGNNDIFLIDWKRLIEETKLTIFEDPLAIERRDPLEYAKLVLFYTEELRKKNFDIRSFLYAIPYNPRDINQRIIQFAESLDFDRMDNFLGSSYPFQRNEDDLRNTVMCAQIICHYAYFLKEKKLSIREFVRVTPSYGDQSIPTPGAYNSDTIQGSCSSLSPAIQTLPVQPESDVTVLDRNFVTGQDQYNSGYAAPLMNDIDVNYMQQNNLITGNVFMKPNIPGDYNGNLMDPTERVNPIEASKRFKSFKAVFTVDSDLFVYTGTHYQLYTEQQFSRLFVHTCNSEYEASGSPNFPKSVYDSLLNDPGINKREVESNKHVLSFQNGLLDLELMKLMCHDPDYLTMYTIQGDYLGQNVLCPIFDKFLDEVTGGDSELITRIYQMIGYIISPKLDRKALFLLQGVPNSGKTLLSSFIESLFNREAVFSMDIERYEGQFNISELIGKALCISPDMSGKPLIRSLVSKLKQITGKDTIGAERKHKSMVTFRNTAAILLGTNYSLVTAEKEEGLEERVVTIPFRYATPKEKRDASLLDKLKNERSAVVTKAINIYHQMEVAGANFAGTYVMNECTYNVDQETARNMDVKSLVYQFVNDNFEKDESTLVFVCDAWELFDKTIGKTASQISENSFNKLFGEYAERIFGAKHTKKRKPKSQDSGGIATKDTGVKNNALSCYVGIRQK